MKKPKILIIDIESAPILASVWGLFDQNVPIGQIKKDWHILSFSGKWLGDPPSKVFYYDQSKVKNVENDTVALKKIWKLLDEADIVLGQNSKRFDVKKLNARFVIQNINNRKPPSPYKQIDTLQIAKKHFGFTSNKLEYMTERLCTKYKKLKHKKYPGFEMWKECLAGNKDAWKEMKKYNIHDVLSTEELYEILAPWENSPNFNLYTDEESTVCNCGSDDFEKRGFSYTTAGKFQRYSCHGCGAWSRGATNLFSKEKRASLRRK